MAQTVIGLNDPKAIKKWSGDLAVDTARKSYFNKKFMGGSKSSAPIQMLTHLENEAGDNLSYDLSLQLKMAPIEGDSVLRGNEEDLNFYTDNIYIDQARAGVNTGGRMSRKRTLHDLRQVAKARQSEWWARMFDEQFFMYLSGSRGINTDFIFPLGYTGRANNPFEAPDAEHVLVSSAGAGGNNGTVEADDKFTLALIDRAISRAVTMGGGTQGTPQIQPIMIDGEEHFVVVMHPWQEYDIRTNASSGEWLDIQKAATAAEGRKNPIFKGSLGMYNNVVLHSHKSVIRDTIDSQSAARALFLGEQAAVCAFGSAGTGMRFDWNEEMEDRGNQVVISTSSIFGIKKCRFNNKDFGIMQLQTAAVDPA